MKVLILSLFLFIPACSLIEEETNWNFPAGIDSLAVEKIELSTVDFSTHIFCGSGCWTGYYFRKTESGNDIYLKLFVTSDGNPCPCVCVERSFSYKYRVIYPGTYTFHFWQNDSASIDTTIVFY